MSNIIISLIIGFIPIIILPFFFLLAELNSFRASLYFDAISFILVFITTFSFYFAVTNFKNYKNKTLLSIKFKFLKEIFLLTAICSTAIGMAAIWASAGQGQSEFTGDLWAKLGLSIGVCFITDLYGILYYFSTSLLANIINRKIDINEKIISKVSSKSYLSFILFILPILFFTTALFIATNSSGFTLFSIISLYDKFPAYLLLVFFMLSFLIVGSNFKFVFRSFLNKPVDIIQINDTIIYIKKLCRIILILCGLIFLSSMVMIAFSFGIESNYYVQSLSISFSNIYFSFVISLIYLIFLRAFLFRLNIELIEKNQISIDSDDYFIFKYCLPIYLSMWITIGFSFLILFFK